MLGLLRERDMTAGEIASRFPLAKSTMSAHFAALRNAGLIVQERQGTMIVYSLNMSAFDEALAFARAFLERKRRRRGRS